MPVTPPFAVTWDYRCPFARVIHEHLVVGLRAGADWDVRFVPFSLDQAHVDDGEPDVWEQPRYEAALLPSRVALVVRDTVPELFLDVHLGLFDARHTKGADLRDRTAIVDVLRDAGVQDPAAVLTEAEQDKWRDVYRSEHQTAVREHHVFGVPTFIVGNTATFVRFMRRPRGDGAYATATIERIVATMTDWPELNELKHTRVQR